MEASNVLALQTSEVITKLEALAMGWERIGYLFTDATADRVRRLRFVLEETSRDLVKLGALEGSVKPARDRNPYIIT
jgi:hypothetical protein